MICSLVGACAVSGNDAGSASEQDVSSTSYVDILDFSGTDQGAWYDGIRSLNAQFDDVCGDTFCEGDWSNITPLTFACAASSKAGKVKDCVYTFAASQNDIDVTTGAVMTNAPTFECAVSAPTTAVKLEGVLAGAGSLQAALPGAPSIYEQIGDCFDHPLGATPGRPAGISPVTYVSANDYYSTAASQQKWREAKAALTRGFDNICGDTFCGSDYGDLQSLDFACSVTKSTGKIKSCAWVFGGSYHVVPAHGGGFLDVTSKTFRCPVAVNGTISQLISTLTATGTTDAINRPLPGKTTSAYDALGGCLP